MLETQATLGLKIKRGKDANTEEAKSVDRYRKSRKKLVELRKRLEERERRLKELEEAQKLREKTRKVVLRLVAAALVGAVVYFTLL